MSAHFDSCREWLLRWSAANIGGLRGLGFAPAERPDALTLIAYTFHADESRFARVEFGILQTWRTIGKYPLVIVVDRETKPVRDFADRHADACRVVLSPDLKAGDPASMNYDCIVNMHRYFKTPYCLIVQDDGFPIRGGVEEFIGKWDYVGAPFVRDKPWQFIADLMLINVENGGFCMRSRRCCEATAQRFQVLKDRLPESAWKLEDQFYCRYARKNLWHRLKYSFAPASKAREFSFIDVEGLIDMKTLRKIPLGIHGPTTIWQFRHYLQKEFGYVIPE